jgi:hypothetical protein
VQRTSLKTSSPSTLLIEENTISDKQEIEGSGRLYVHNPQITFLGVSYGITTMLAIVELSIKACVTSYD